MHMTDLFVYTNARRGALFMLYALASAGWTVAFDAWRRFDVTSWRSYYMA